MTKGVIAAIVAVSALCIGGIASVAYWIADPGASDLFLYVAPIAGLLGLATCGIVALRITRDDRR